MKPLAPSGRCITNQGSVPATPDTPMTISWRRLHRDHGREHFIAALPWSHPIDQGAFLPLWKPDQPRADWMCVSASALNPIKGPIAAP
ncbi:MAG: hypothetical protein HWE30_18110 [Methylocystaceae bacterium]|nr:hypothetical protein [Methylocystaceae bacterium]